MVDFIYIYVVQHYVMFRLKISEYMIFDDKYLGINLKEICT